MKTILTAILLVVLASTSFSRMKSSEREAIRYQKKKQTYAYRQKYPKYYKQFTEIYNETKRDNRNMWEFNDKVGSLLDRIKRDKIRNEKIKKQKELRIKKQKLLEEKQKFLDNNPNPIKGFKRWKLGEKLSIDDMLSDTIISRGFQKYFVTSTKNFKKIEVRFNIDIGVICSISVSSKPFLKSDKTRAWNVLYSKIRKTYDYMFKDCKYIHRYEDSLNDSITWTCGERSITLTTDSPKLFNRSQHCGFTRSMSDYNQRQLAKRHRMTTRRVIILIRDKTLLKDAGKATGRAEYKPEKMLDL